MSCIHEWQGVSDGVICVKCGKKLTAKKYAETINPKATKKAVKKNAM